MTRAEQAGSAEKDGVVLPATPPESVDFTAMRHIMVESQLRPSDVSDPVVVAAMAVTPRESFVDPDYRMFAYMDRAVPQGDNRPLNPALAIGLLLTRAQLTSTDRVLVIGCGSGYAAALLAGIVGSVVALEESSALAAMARTRLAAYPNVTVVEGALTKGHAKDAPYSVIVIDGAVEDVPSMIIDQLAIDGRLVAGLVEQGVTRLAMGRKSHETFRLVPFADSDIAPLSAFAKPRTYQF